MTRIIKTVWGDLDYVKNETNHKFKFKDEIIYVWGSDNNEYLRSIGYDTIMVSPDQCNPSYNNMDTKYYHKLDVIRLADSDFGDYILIDWDTYSERILDDYFFELLRKKSEIQCPLYSLPNNFFPEISKLNMTEDYKSFFYNQNKLIPKFSWEFNGSRVIPNFSFFYSRNAKIGNSLFEIAKSNNLLSNVEEFSLYKYLSCTLGDYINNHEPIVAIGQIRDSMPCVQKSLDELNSMIGSIIKKIDYIKHK